MGRCSGPGGTTRDRAGPVDLCDRGDRSGLDNEAGDALTTAVGLEKAPLPGENGGVDVEVDKRCEKLDSG